MRRAACVLLMLLSCPAPRAAADEAAPVAVTLEPWAALDGVERPHRYVVTMRSMGSMEVVADRRLLAFEVRPEGGRRAQRCRHPRLPSRVSSERVRTLAPGEVWQEWIDLRMYCWGRALDALETGGEVTARYGFRRPSPTRWVGRVPGSRSREWTGGVDVEPFRFPAIASTAEATPSGEPRVRVTLAATSARNGASIRFRVAVRAVEERPRVYVRPDAFAFAVRGPGASDALVRCELVGGGGTPMPDLYRRINERTGWRELLDAGAYCPPDTFEAAGVYEVTPEVSLEHDGEEWHLDAVTGRFTGVAAPLRITTGDHGYVEQIPERSERLP